MFALAVFSAQFPIDIGERGIYTKFRVSKLPVNRGEVAQSVERETENLCVGGSIPSLATPQNPLEFFKSNNLH